MNAYANGVGRAVAIAAICAFTAVAATGCGAPRVHEVYRLTAADLDMAEPSLNETQRDLRRVALQAQALRPKGAAHDEDRGIATLATIEPSMLHECAPGYLAEFTAASAFAPSDELQWLALQPTSAEGGL